MRKLCKNCFSERKSRTCPVCGYSGGGGNNTGNALKRGTRLAGRYTIGGVIGSGSFGITYIAYDLKNDTITAVKEYFPRLIAVREGNGSVRASSEKYGEIYRHGAEEFYREAEYVFQFNGNPNIVSVSDYFYENNTSYVVMEYLFGITLEKYVKNYGTLTDAQTVYIAEKILMALIAVHSAQLLHRDISPDNIMLCADGKVKLIDFGAARQLTADSLPELTVIMKNGFSPAEQYMRNGSFGEWTDIYSLGAVLYYAVTGNVPENPYERMISDGELDFYGKSTNSALQDIICKAVSISKAKRYKSAAEMKKAVSEMKIKGERITFPDNFEPFKVTSFSATAPNGYSVGKKSKYLSYLAIGALAVSSSFFFGMTVQNTRNEQTIQAMQALHSENTAVPDEEQKDTSFSTETVSEIQSAESSTPKTPVTIAFDGEFKENFEYYGIVPVSQLKNFGGDVKITVDFAIGHKKGQDDQEEGVGGFIPTDGSGKCVIEYLSTGNFPWADENGLILITDDDIHYEMTISWDGIEKLQGGSFGFELYNLAVKSVTLENGEKIGKYYFHDYSDYYLDTVKSTNDDGSTVITADITEKYIDSSGINHATIPRSAFLEFDGDVLMTLEIEHTGSEDFQGFLIGNRGALWSTLDGRILLTEMVDRKKSQVLLQYVDKYWIYPDKELSECSVIVPRKAVEKMSGGIFFHVINMKIKSVRLESADKEVEYGNVSN